MSSLNANSEVSRHIQSPIASTLPMCASSSSGNDPSTSDFSEQDNHNQSSQSESNSSN